MPPQGSTHSRMTVFTRSHGGSAREGGHTQRRHRFAYTYSRNNGPRGELGITAARHIGCDTGPSSWKVR